MVSLDAGVIPSGKNVVGDTFIRHRRYAQALYDQDHSGGLEIVVPVRPNISAGTLQLADGLRVHQVPTTRAAFALKARPVIRRLFEDHVVDVITTQTPFDDGLLGAWAARHQRVGLNVQMRSSFLDAPRWINERPARNRLLNVIGKYVARRAATVRVVSQGEKQRLERRFGWTGRVVALHPFVNRRLFEHPVVELPKDLPNRPFVLYVGRFVREKNIPLILSALRLVKHNRRDVVLVAIGDGPLHGELRATAGKLGIADNVIWVGARPLNELPTWYRAATCTVVPSYYEGFGKVIAESHLSGTPVIATPFVSAPELVVDEETGFLLRDFDDPAALAERIELLLRDPALAVRLGEGAHRHVSSYLLDDDQYLAELLRIWEATASAFAC